MEPTQRSILRVVHVSFGLDVGGQEKLLVEFSRHADQSRFELVFVSLGDRGALAGDLENCGARVVTMGEPLGLKPRLLYRLSRMLRRMRPDVIHTHDHRALFYAGPAAWAARVPLVINTRHGKNFHLTPRQVAIGRHLARLVDRYVCVSDDVRSQCIAEGIAPSRLLTILNGIDVEQFAFSGPAPAGKIVAVARLSPEKDVANLVRAMAIAVRQDPGVCLEVAGDGPCLPELRRLVSDLGLGVCVSFLGQVRNVPGLLAQSGLFVLPSRSEGISLTLLEAMARGLPVVATRVGGTPEVVVEGQTGLLVPPGDPAALAEALLLLRRDPEAGRRMGAAGRRRVERLFDVRRMVAEYEELYRQSGRSVGRDAHHRANARTAN